MRNGPIQQPIPIGKPSVLVAKDLERLRENRYVPTTPQKLRDSHHMIARLAAMGLRIFQIAEKTGYSAQRVRDLVDSPAMKELIARYRQKVDEEFVENADEFFSTATANMLLAEKMISDQLSAADESGELPSIRTLDTLSQGRADRFGYGKKTQNLNINVDFASQLERAIQRSGKGPVLEGSVAADATSPTNARTFSPKHSLPPPSVAVPAPHGGQQSVAASTSPGDTHLTRRPMAQPQPLLRRRA